VHALRKEEVMTNLVLLHGRVTRLTERELPSGDRLALIDLTIPGEEGERADSVPLAWFSAPDWIVSAEPGSELVVLGRVRRRFFQGGQQGGLQSRTEVVVERAAPAGRTGRVADIVRRATGQATVIVESR
jgi:hypothetical protein